MPNPVAALHNLGLKAVRRLMMVHKPLVRHVKRRTRAREFEDIERRALEVEHEIAKVATGNGPIIAGPWLAEVGYEVLYWLPFLRWFQDRYRVDPDRMVVLTRGGCEHWYAGIATRYVDLYDHLSPSELAALNDARQEREEGGGRKQSSQGEIDERLLDIARREVESATARVLHPSMMFRLFRDVWQGNLAPDFLWSRTNYSPLSRPPRPVLSGLPNEYATVKLYSGTALPDTRDTRDLLQTLVRRVSQRLPVIVLDTNLNVDDHSDYSFGALPNVMSAAGWMTPRDNLGVQTALVAHSQYFLGTCGGLAWLAPFLGVFTAAVYTDDRLLAPHLMVARQAGRRVGAAELSPVDLRAWSRLGLDADAPRAVVVEPGGC